MPNDYTYTVILEPDPEGGYAVSVPALPGCFTQGETREEALAMAREAIALHVESLRIDGLPVPREDVPPEAVAVHVAA
jgi:antitoxin HicB